MSAKDQLRKIGFWKYMRGGVIAIVFDVALLYFLYIHEINTWWYFVTTIVSFLIADGSTLVLDKVNSRYVNENTVPIAFALFCLFVLVEAIVGDRVIAGIASVFNTVSLAAYLAFFGLSLLPTAFLYLDFLLRYRFRRRPKASLRLYSDCVY